MTANLVAAFGGSVKMGRRVFASVAVLTTIFCIQGINAIAQMPAVSITNITQNQDSVKVRFARVNGAADYRIYDKSDPSVVKYAGQVHLFADPGYQFAVNASGQPVYPYQDAGNTMSASSIYRLDVPALEIEWNGMVPGKATTLVVEAVSKQGAFPYANLANSVNAPAMSPTCQCSSCSHGICKCKSCKCAACLCGSAATMPMPMLGSNSGGTLDGKTSINGQGSYKNIPVVIARSKPFTVTLKGNTALPSGPDATQVFFDTFANSQASLTPIGVVDSIDGIENFTLTTAAGTWDVATRNVDTTATSIMVERNHLMDVMYDGSTPGSNNPLHIAHGSVAYSPHQNFDFSNGQILHVTYEVDAHVDSRRWVGVNLAPANDPITNWYLDQQINQSDQAVYAQVGLNGVALNVFLGPNSPTNSAPVGDAVLGAAGQALRCPWPGRPVQNFQMGHGLDNRSRIDLFFSQTHYAWYEDGFLIDSYDFPDAIPFSQTKVYFTHYLYHTGNEIAELINYYPYETFWINDVTFSDERHWDNMGVEVLPQSTDWSTLSQRVQLPAPVAPKY